MIRFHATAVLLLALAACKQQSVSHARITQFKAVPAFLPTGIAGKLCYGVENASRLDLNPPVEAILPASERCLDIAPRQTTAYTLTAYGTDGAQEKKTLEVRVGAPPPRVSDLSAVPTHVKRGGRVKVCFKVENAKSVSAKPGKLDRRANCLTDNPRKTTVYRITAAGADREEDAATVTVEVTK